MCNNINPSYNGSLNPSSGIIKGDTNSPLGGTKRGLHVGILGAAGYTGGELIRLLVNHPEAEIVFANSESNAGNPVADVHEGLIGDTDLVFTDDMPFDKVDIVFFCFGHGKSAAFLKEHSIPESVKIIDLAQDFRLSAPGNDYIYGLPEINRNHIATAQHVANPGCFATCIQLGLLPAAKMGTLTRGIFATCVVKTEAPTEDIVAAYKEFYRDAAFTHYSDRQIDMKQVVNTNKALVHCEKYGNKLLVTSCIDNLLKGAVGQAVQNMNIMSGIDEKTGLNLKASAF